MRNAILLISLLASPLAASSEDPAQSTPTIALALSADSPIDDILDALDARGKNLESLSAIVEKSEADAALGEDTETRIGRIVYQRLPDGAVRIRASFDKVKIGDKVKEDRVEYVLDNGQLVDRSYRSKVEVRRIVQRPGERIDLFKLGQGPFPLPIGQDKAAVHNEFEVTKVAPAAGDPVNTVHLKLAPRPTSDLSRKFKSIDVWMDRADHMPRRISTLNPQESVLTTTELSDVKLNAEVQDKDFALEKIKDDEWKITQE